MEIRSITAARGGSASRMTLRIGRQRYPILAQDREGCLIRALEGAPLRGYADIYDGETHRARCLILLSAPEGEFIRLAFKRRTAVLAAPPRDFAPD